MKITYDDLSYYPSFQEFTNFLLPLLLPFTEAETIMITCRDERGFKTVTSAGRSSFRPGTLLPGEKGLMKLIPEKADEVRMIEDTSRFPEMEECSHYLKIRSCLTAPIILRSGNICGFLHAFDSLPHVFSESSADHLTRAARVIARTLSLEHQAVHDPRTGTFNKEFLVDYFNRYTSPAALFHIKINDFSSLFQQLGREETSHVLQEAAVRLKKTAGREALTAGSGTEEFFLLVFRNTSREALAGWGDKIQKAFRAPFFSEKTPVKLKVSIGISRSPADSRSIEDLFYYAEAALYESQKHMKNTAVFYYPGLRNALTLEKSIIEDLPHAFKNKEFSLVYQPQFDADTKELRGVEAFIRWLHPDIGFIQPADFLPAASRSGLIKHIDRWVIEEACRTAAALQDKYPLSLSVNLTSFAYYPEELTSFILKTLEKTGLPPRHLELELAESEGTFPLDEAKSSLEKLYHFGIRTALGNFGSGNASFSSVQSLPLHTLKLDRSFTKKMLENKEQEKVVEQMITVAHMFDVIVIGEGVESSEQWLKLNALGCDYVQGFYCGKPVSLAILESFLENDPTFSNAYDSSLRNSR